MTGGKLIVMVMFLKIIIYTPYHFNWNIIIYTRAPPLRGWARSDGFFLVEKVVPKGILWVMGRWNLLWDLQRTILQSPFISFTCQNRKEKSLNSLQKTCSIMSVCSLHSCCLDCT